MKISIVTVTFNALEDLLRTRSSLKSQKNAEFEWIIIDGASTDSTVETVSHWSEVNYFASEPDSGIYDGMNKGARAATGDYVWFLNAGDVCESETSISELNALVGAFDVYYLSARMLYGSSMNYIRRPRDAVSAIKYSVPGNQQATLYRRKLLLDFPFDIGYKICGDYYLSAVLIRAGCTTCSLDLIVCKFNIGGRSTFSFKRLICEAYRVQRCELGLGFFYSNLLSVRRFLSMCFTISAYQIGKLKS